MNSSVLVGSPRNSGIAVSVRVLDECVRAALPLAYIGGVGSAPGFRVNGAVLSLEVLGSIEV